MAELSAGNQRRVQFAAAVAADPEILIIDEPANYLDLDTTEALEAALAAWNGTLLVASHDRWLVAHWSGPRLHLTSALQDHRPMTRADEPRRLPRRGDVHETRTRIG